MHENLRGFSASLFERARRLGSLLDEPRFQDLRRRCRDAIERWSITERHRLDQNDAYSQELFRLMVECQEQDPTASGPDLYTLAQGRLLLGNNSSVPNEPLMQVPQTPLPLGEVEIDHVLVIVAGLHDYLVTTPETIGPRTGAESSSGCESSAMGRESGALYHEFIQKSLPRLTARNLEDLEACLEQLKPPLPAWNKDTGELTIDGKLAKRIRNLAKNGRPTNVVQILNSFQESGWPTKIDDPLRGGRDPERLAETLRSLNENLSLIRFSKDGSGSGIRWERISPSPGSPPALP